MKRFLSMFSSVILLLFVIAVCFFCFPTKAQALTSGYYTYIVYNGEATITDVSASVSGNVVIPNTLGGYPVTSIGAYAFEDCSNLTEITIPYSVTYIGDGALANRSRLVGIKVDVGNTAYCSDEQGVLYDKEKTALLQVPGGITGAYTILDGVTSIGAYAFRGCSSLQSITIPDSVTTIGGYAFDGCTALTNITIPVGVKTVGGYIFSGCSGLESLTIPFVSLNLRQPDGSLYVTDFGGYFSLFSYAGSIAVSQSIIYPTSGGSHSHGQVFYIPASLKSVTVTGGSIDNGSFVNCSMLTNIAVGDDVSFDRDGVTFRGCTNLAAITVSESNPVYSNDTYGALFDKDMTTLIAVPMTVNNYVIPDSITHIGERAFEEHTKLKSITIPDSVTYIGWRAFYQCNNLDAVFYRGSNSQKESITIEAACAPLTAANWHCNIEDVDFGGQNCYYCPDCDDYYLPTGESAFATITFLDWDGTKLSEEKVRYKAAVTIPKNPTRQHMQPNIYEYVFTGWDKEIAVSCTGNVTYTAQYSSNYIDYTITFKNWDNTIISTETYHWGDTVTAPTAPTKAANNIYTYTFAGWDSDVVNCAGNATYKATFFSDYVDYKVVFKNWDETILSVGTYHWGDVVTAPATPAKEADNTYSYAFNGWDKDVVDCAGNATYTATYTSTYIDYTVVFKNWNGDVLSTKTYHYGDKVTAPANPTRAADKTYTYTFNGWDSAVVDCAGNATYTATYTSDYIDYTVTFQYDDGTVIKQHTVHYGDSVVAPADPAVPDALGDDYEFAGWDKEITDCQGDAVYTAVFVRKYISGDLTGDDKINSLDGLLLMRYLNGWNVNIASPEAMDVNGDGKVNSLDGLILMRYLNGWDVTLG